MKDQLLYALDSSDSPSFRAGFEKFAADAAHMIIDHGVGVAANSLLSHVKTASIDDPLAEGYAAGCERLAFALEDDFDRGVIVGSAHASKVASMGYGLEEWAKEASLHDWGGEEFTAGVNTGLKMAIHSGDPISSIRSILLER